MKVESELVSPPAKPDSAGPAGRARISLRGLCCAWRRDRAFRELTVALAAGWAMLAVVGPRPWWWVVVLALGAASLAGELFNSAIEATLDRLHPDRDPAIGAAKDLASAGAFVLNAAAFAAIGIAVALG